MVESLKELNKICQKPRYKEVGNWMVRYILRDLALPITWCLLHTPVTANQVTFAALLIGFAGNILCASSTAGLFLTGMILLQFWYLLDHVDGQIARYRKTVSLTGRYFDFLMHHLLHGSFFAFAGTALYASSRQEWILGAAFSTSFFVISFNLLSDIKHKTFMERIALLNSLSLNNGGSGESQPKNAGFAKTLFSFLHKLIEFHIVMNVYTGAAILEASMQINIRPHLFFVYSITAPLVFVTKAFYWIQTKKIDQEYHGTFKENDAR